MKNNAITRQSFISKIKPLLILLCFSGPLLHGQSEMEIKTSGQYHWGEGQGGTLTEAKEIALRELVNGISVTVSARTSNQLVETSAGVDEDYRSLTETVSRLTLKGVGYVTGQRRGTPVALAFISKADYLRSLNALADEVRSMIKLNEGPATKLQTIYEIYLRCFFSPEPISFESRDQQQYPDARLYLKHEIEEKLQEVQIRTGAPSIDRDVDLVTIPIEASRLGRPVSGLQVGIAGSNEPPLPLKGDRGELYLYSLPNAPKMTLAIAVRVGLSTMAEPDLMQLQELHPLEHVKSIDLDLSTQMRYDFTTRLMANGALLFTPSHEGFSLSRLDWDFGDGESSSATQPLHKFSGAGPYLVKLWFNNRPEFGVQKQVWADGKLQAMVTSKPETVLHPEPQAPAGKASTSIIKETETEIDPSLKEPESPHLPEIMLNLMDAADYNSLGGRLEKFKSIHKLMFGKQSAFINPQACYVFVIKPKTGEIAAVLGPGNEQRPNLRTGEVHTGLGDFKGHATIYVEINDAP